MKSAVILACLHSALAFGAAFDNPLQPLNRFRCEELLNAPSAGEPGPVEFHTSGRDNGLENSLREDTKIITKIAHDLGMATPPHKVYFVPDEQLNVMAALGGQPTPTWMDGHTISTSMGQVMGVMEFVTPGCPTCRSYYSDKTALIHQRAVIMHVMGHNDMASTARVIAERQTDAPADGLLLANKISEAYQKYDHDEVSMFVQWLNSLDKLQDFTYGAVERPDKFKIEDRNRSKDLLSWTKTANPLQALVHQLDPSAPAWKREILDLYERVQRVYPAYANSKIMNEGWASFAEYIIGRHAPASWKTTHDIVEYATMMSGVAYPSLSNPYWVGLMGWWNLYEQFKRKEEIKKLGPFEQDKAFIAWARKTYATQTDFEWLQMSIDQEFTDRWRLFIYRQTQRHEMDPGIPPEKQGLIALSRDAVRIRQLLIRRLVDRSLVWPRIALDNPSVKDPSKLSFHHELQHNLPLDVPSAFKTLFVHAQTFNKRASLAAYVDPRWVPEYLSHLEEQLIEHLIEAYGGSRLSEEQLEEIREWVRSMDPATQLKMATHYGLIKLDEIPLPQVELEVSPSGEVKANLLAPGNMRVEIPELAEAGAKAIFAYKEDLLTSLNPEMAAAQKRKWDIPTMKLSDVVTNPAMEIVQYAPHAGGALQELIQMIETRFPKVFKKAVADGSITPTRRGVSLKVLPEIPEFRYDFAFKNSQTRSKPVGPVDDRHRTAPPVWDLDDNGSQIMGGEQLPGDKFAAPPKNKGNGQGEGEADDGDEEADGEPSDNDGKEPKPGNGSSSSSDIEIPLSLYGELLANELELPNLRRTEGESEKTKTVHKGKVHKPAGQLMWHEIAVEAMHIARATRKAKGLPYEPSQGVSPYVLIREGMAYIDQSNYVVRGKTTKPLPDFDAVLVVNLDVTGSMMGERIQMAKNLVFNIKALLSAAYKNVKIHYVVFDSTAEEVPESRVWTIWKGGGTAYAPALIEDQKILAKYPNSRWNKYVLTIGDGETSDGEAYLAELDKMVKDLQYAGHAITTNGAWGGYEPFLSQLVGYKDKWPWIGSSVIKEKSQVISALKELFPKGPSSKK